MNRTTLTALTAILLTSACSGDMPVSPAGDLDPSFAFGSEGAVYEVTVENLSSGQPLTPALLAAHRSPADVFEVGEAASPELQQIAENGRLGPMMKAFAEDKHVRDHAVAFGPGAPDLPPILPGESATAEIEATLGSTRLSWVSMLICTNDGFTGVDGIALPVHPGDVITRETDAYDAGTEMNTEDFQDLVPPCGPLTGVDSGGQGTGMTNPALAENGVIHHHPGIQGIADLDPAVHGWNNPVARITIERVQ